MKVQLSQPIRVVLPLRDDRASDGAVCNEIPIWRDDDRPADFDLSPRMCREIRLAANTVVEIDDADAAWFDERLPGLLLSVDPSARPVRSGGMFPGRPVL